MSEDPHADLAERLRQSAFTFESWLRPPEEFKDVMRRGIAEHYGISEDAVEISRDGARFTATVRQQPSEVRIEIVTVPQNDESPPGNPRTGS